MDSSSKIRGCINITTLLPVTKLEQNINAVSSLIYNDDDAYQEFLQKVDQPLLVQSDKGGFICCEYNRDGDSYRIPGTKEYVPPLQDGTVPQPKLLELEEALNKIFKIYTKFYYSPLATCSIYCYEKDEDDSNNFIVAVLIKNKIEENTSKGTNGIWEASNMFTVSIDPGAREVTYDLVSSVTVYLNASIKTGKNSKLSAGGTMMKTAKETHKYSTSEPDIQFHTDHIGTMVENLETRIRDEIEVIYFQKTTQIVCSTRDFTETQNTINNLRNIMSNI